MSGENKNKSELLKKLRIDREVTPKTGIFPYKIVFVISIVSAFVGGSISYFLINPTDTSLIDLRSSNRTIEQEKLKANPEDYDQSTVTNPSQQEKSVSSSILNASGYITPRRMATVSSKIMGLIVKVNVEEGMRVLQGQILAQLDDTLAQVNLKLAIAQIEALEARQKSARASLLESQKQFQRIKNNDYSSEAEHSQAKTNMETSQANLIAASADIKVAQFEIIRQREYLADHTIRSPFDGVVTKKNAQPGEIVSPSSAGGGFTRTGICTIVDMESLEIEVDVNESFIGRVYSGQKVVAQLDAYSDWSIPATVIAIIPTADRAKATVRVRIKIDIKDEKILPEMGIKVAFLQKE